MIVILSCHYDHSSKPKLFFVPYGHKQAAKVAKVLVKELENGGKYVKIYEVENMNIPPVRIIPKRKKQRL